MTPEGRQSRDLTGLDPNDDISKTMELNANDQLPEEEQDGD